MRLAMVFPAPDGALFTEESAAKLVGKRLPLRDKEDLWNGKIESVEVVRNGEGLLVRAFFSEPIPRRMLLDLARDPGAVSLPTDSFPPDP